MNREELCGSFGAPPDTPAADLLAAWERRRADLSEALARDGLAKPVRLRLREELRRLDEAGEVAAHLRIEAQIDRFLADAGTEWSRPAPAWGVLQLCLDKARPLLEQLPEGDLRFGCEKRLAAAADRLAASQRSAAVAEAPSPASVSAHEPAIGVLAEEEPRAAAGNVLELTGMAPAGPGLPYRARLVAGPQFTLGRRSNADLVARFEPESEENRQRTSTISRVNTTLYTRGNQVWVQDGELAENGASARPSTNGTWLEEQRLSGSVPVNFSRERRLRLGQFGFEVRAQHFPGSSPLGPLRSGSDGAGTQQATVFLPERPIGCLRLLGGPILLVWILSEAAIGSAPGAAVALPASAPAFGAVIHHWKGGFWLALPAGIGPGAVIVDGHPRAPGDVIPLQTGHQLVLGREIFDVKIS